MSTRARTWWFLENATEKPSPYQLASSRLLYHPTRGYAVQTPVTKWLAQHPVGLVCDDWEKFSDPRQLTYAKYTEQQHQQEIYVQGLFESLESSASDANRTPSQRALLEQVTTLRYPLHALQMCCAYLGSSAPGGRVVIAYGLQSANQIRRVQHLAYRLALLKRADPNAGAGQRSAFEQEPGWQPLRKLLERLLVTYRWGEAFVVLSLLLMPVFDAWFVGPLAERVRESNGVGDETLARVLGSFDGDARWHRSVTQALVAQLFDSTDNRAQMTHWLEVWHPQVRAAMAGLADVFSTSQEQLNAVWAQTGAWQTGMGLSVEAW